MEVELFSGKLTSLVELAGFLVVFLLWEFVAQNQVTYVFYYKMGAVQVLDEVTEMFLGNFLILLALS